MNFKGKTVLITGASSGIGKACAEEFAKKGANLVLAARQYVTLCEITADLEKRYPVKAIAVSADVSKEDDCEQLVRQAMATFGGIDILLNNAGISMRALFSELDLSVLKKLMDVNFWGTVYCTKYALSEIQKTKGSIIGVSSIAGYRGLPGRTGYSASKFAMNGFMESLRTELLHTGVHVMVACPGFTASNIRVTALSADGESHGETSMDEGKMMTAEQVAADIVKGVISRKRTLIMGGQGKLTVWINKLFPALADKLVFNHFTKEKKALIK
ncbi:SDR family oxidoreductase [Pedobacter nutrimenti]|jgi:short-subunit dehydrogenase|uniref:Short-subunit dehydrogenase n=1 Tax=Pedobacter nutrimenti TaxID=1241337 RepID=A0A318UBR1_9SPHI|nr:SDR family oxidoreductase [Pedobacter nutrimenti]PYF72672.1 short-subunit dehydrogenase [Pedobacter nutrimenti]